MTCIWGQRRGWIGRGEPGGRESDGEAQSREVALSPERAAPRALEQSRNSERDSGGLEESGNSGGLVQQGFQGDQEEGISGSPSQFRHAALSQGTSGCRGVSWDDPTLRLRGRPVTQVGKEWLQVSQVPPGKDSSSYPCVSHSSPGQRAASGEHWLVPAPDPAGFPALALGWWAELAPSAWEERQDTRVGWALGGWGRWTGGFWLPVPPLAAKVRAPGSCLGPYAPLLSPTPAEGRQQPEPQPQPHPGLQAPAGLARRTPSYPGPHPTAGLPRPAQWHALRQRHRAPRDPGPGAPLPGRLPGQRDTQRGVQEGGR